jgi:dipeptidyl aminopeptidase/acylaminoacyl peptidase
MRRWVKLAAIVLLSLPVHVVVGLALLGVPKPPAITAEDVGRVGWGPVFDNAEQLWRSRASKSLVTWLPDGDGVLVRARRWILDSRLQAVASPGARPVFLAQLPRNVAGAYSEPGRGYMILGWDTDGDEQHRLYRWDLGEAEPVLLTTAAERASFGAFERDGKRIAYTSTRRNGRDFDVYVMDPERPDSDQRVLEVDGMWAVAGWSPIADELLLLRFRSNVESELLRFDLATGILEPVPGATGEGAAFAFAQWSRDGSALYYVSDRGTEFKHLRRLDLSSGEERVLTDEIPWDVSSVQQSADGDLLLLSVNEDGATRWYTSDALAEVMAPLELFASGQFVASLHPDAASMLVNHVDELGVGRGYVYEMARGELTLWAGPEPAAGRGEGHRLVRYPTFDSVAGAPRTISAFVYPGEGEGPRPVVIDIHGGPEAQARLRVGTSSTQRDGITVITPNVRGSTGYGRTFASLDDQYLREDAVRDIGALLDWIEEQSDMDASRVAVQGGSYGGYMVLASLVHFSPRLACGIDVVGVSNFVTFLENTAEYRKDLRRAEYGDERDPEMRAFLESIAPLNHADRITSPLMVVQGANDPRVPVGESRQVVEAVRGNGLRVGYMEGANEGHGFRDPWNAFYAGLAQQQLIRECLAGG